MNTFDLSRNFFDFCFDNPEKVRPSHIAIYFFAIEHCNRLGWKEKFGFPTQMVIDAIGINKPHTYIKYFDDLVEWGFFKLIQKSRNQYSSNIICLSSAMPKNGRALSKAIQKHAAKQTESIRRSNGPINKPINQEHKNQERESRAHTREDFEKLVASLFEEHPEEFEKFCDYWCALNQLNDQMRWQEDPYFNPALKVRSWLDRSRQSSTPNHDHIHQEFLNLWILKTDPKNQNIEAARNLLSKMDHLKTADLIRVLKKDQTADLDALITRAGFSRTKPREEKETPSEALKCAKEPEPTIDELKAIRDQWPEDKFNQMYSGYLHLLEEADNTT